MTMKRLIPLGRPSVIPQGWVWQELIFSAMFIIVLALNAAGVFGD